MRWFKLTALLWGLILFVGFSSVSHAALTVNDVAQELICNCGCNKVLTECGMQYADQLREIIKTKLREGWDKPRIVQFMVQNYGEQILAAPTKEGFNLTAWVTPFLALFAGAGIVGLVIRRWAGQASPSASDLDAAHKEYLERKHGARLEEELKRFE
jgi:cytochrome c-type biogenesis protein CcmH